MAEGGKSLEGSSVSGRRREETLPDTPMSREHCRLLRLNHAALVEHMSPGHILPVLVSLGVITLEMQEEIIGERVGTRQEINERLLNVLPTRGDRAFGGLCQGLREGGKQGYLVSLLENTPGKPDHADSKRHELGINLQPRTKEELISRLETQLRQTREELEALQQSRIQEAQQSDQAGKLAATEKQLEALQNKMEVLENKLSQREREKRELYSRHANLKENFKKYREGKESTIETLKKEYRHSSLLKTKCNHQKQEIALLKSKVAELEKALRRAGKSRDGKSRTRKMETKATMTEKNDDVQVQQTTPRREVEEWKNNKENSNLRVEVQRHQRASLQRIHLRHNNGEERNVTVVGDNTPIRHDNGEKIKQAVVKRRQAEREEKLAQRGQREGSGARRREPEKTGLEREYRRDTAASRNKFEAFLSQSSG